MKDINREYVRAYIQDHNITRPIWLTQAGFIFLPSSLLFITVLVYIYFHKDLFDCLVLIINTIYAIIGFVCSKENKKLYACNKGKALYKAQEILYILLLISLTTVGYLYKCYADTVQVYDVIAVAVGILILYIAGALYAYMSQNRRIKKGFYLEKEKKEKKVFNDIKYIPLYIVIAGFLKRIRNESFINMFFLTASIFIVTYCSYYATTYWLKLRYAKKYDMEEYLPTEPI